MKREYVAPELEIFEYKVERGYAWSGATTEDNDDDIITGGCGCKGWDCTCSSRSGCKGSGVAGCMPKGKSIDSYDEWY